ncbi:unnamed protein product [Angiostrongylus costaricensis]|uniref:PspC domain-containing protein n=1 Tax=Angiostrongylus costaricensis TaxID=334426 RepID=A0A0R3PBH1_ANGCS|nr:unnamed protein product [Angiostrongylus costaricensis]
MVVGALVCRLSGFLKKFIGQKNILQISCYIFYGVPLLSTVFYAMCFISLRSQRSLVRSDNTMSLLHQAERDTLKQGIVTSPYYATRSMTHLIYCISFKYRNNNIKIYRSAFYFYQNLKSFDVKITGVKASLPQTRMIHCSVRKAIRYFCLFISLE